MNTPTFEKILFYFEATSVSNDKKYSVYMVNIKTTNYLFYFFKSNGVIKCFSTNSFRVISQLEMIYILSDKTNFEYISSLIKIIEQCSDVYILNDINEDQLVDDIISIVLDIQSPISGLQNQIFESESFESKVFVKDNLMCFPLFNKHFKLSNICLITGNEINNNSGVFLSNRLGTCKELAIFFNPKSLIEHTETFYYREFYYALFSSNIDISDFNLIFDLSVKYCLPVTLYMSTRTDFSNAFKIFNSLVSNFPSQIKRFELTSNPNEFKFHLYAAPDCMDIMPLSDICQEINRTLIIHYNEEMKIADEDLSKSLKFIHTSSSKLFGSCEMNISFPAHTDAFCAVLNALGRLYGVKDLKFSNM